MPVDRKQLESIQETQQAAKIIDEIRKNTDEYPNDVFLARKGICKVIEEEYVPLVRVAESVLGERVRLSPHSHRGRDGEIWVTKEESLTVQITCAHEGLGTALKRRSLAEDGAVITQISSRDVDARVTRILSAISMKEENYHPHTKVLIVLDAPASASYLSELKPRVAQAVCARPSNYQKIFVVYGEDVRQVK
jgi:hypothetical protein